jgi:Tol biopolymer transport system component
MESRGERRFVQVWLLALAAVVVVTPTATAYAETYVYEEVPPSGQSADGDFWVTEDAATPRLLPIWGENPALDPTATRVVYSNHGSLYLTDLQGATPEHVIDTAPQCLCTPMPQWYPDGQSIITDGVDVNGSLGIVKVTRSGGQWTTSNVIDWPGSQIAPSVSPDAGKVAFLSYTKPNGDPVSPWGVQPALFVADADGSNPVQLTTPNYGESSYLDLSSLTTTSFSPDGRYVAVAGWGTDDAYSEIYTVDVISGGLHQVTTNSESEDYPDWLPDGRIAYMWTPDTASGNNGQFRSIQPDGSDEANVSPEFTQGELLEHISAPQPTDTSDRLSHAALLDEYAPQLRYDSQETFFADLASEVTDYAGEATNDSGNDLRYSTAGVRIAGHVSGLPDLSLDFLNSAYPDGTAANDVDYLDEEQSGSGYSVAANFMRNLPGYADWTYGRVVGSGSTLWLQYWFFYYDNPFAPVLGRGSHEGDWEMVQIGLDRATLIPQEAVYSQHDTSEQCPWSQVSQQTYGTDSAPVDYVAAGSHANYFTAGSHGGVLGVGADNANGDLSPPVRPTVFDVNVVPGWMFWPGKWGKTTASPSIGTVPTGADSPRGPVFHDEQWNHPAQYAADATGCTVPQPGGSTSQRPEVAQQAPQPPAISAHLEGNRALIHYRLSRIGRNAQGLAILLTIQGTGRSDTPVGMILRPRRDIGRHQLPLPIGRAPFIVRASALSRHGARSPIVSKRLADRQ